MSGPILIRSATPADAHAVASLSATLGYGATPEDAARRLDAVLASKVDAALMALDPRGAAVGFIHVALALRLESDAFAEIGGLVVAPAARRMGVGRALVEAGEAWARERGLQRIRVRSRVEREEAHEFYRRLGYASTKTQLVLGKTLPPSPLP